MTRILWASPQILIFARARALSPRMIRAALLVMLGLVTFIAVYAVMQPETVDRPSARPPPTTAEIEAEGLSAEEAPENVPIDISLRPGVDEPAFAVRDVTPENMTPGPEVTGPLVRVEQPAENAPPHAREARMQRLFNPLVVSADRIKVREREIALAGIDAPDFDARCGEVDAAWPCGRMARAALRRFIRGRAIECEVPAGVEEIPDVARCEVAGQDMSEWLVAQGWARKTAQSYADAETAARNAKRGLWADRRPDAPASSG